MSPPNLELQQQCTCLTLPKFNFRATFQQSACMSDLPAKYPRPDFGLSFMPGATLAYCPRSPESTLLYSVFEDLTAYKNWNGAIWGRGQMHVFRNVKLADNANGFTHAFVRMSEY